MANLTYNNNGISFNNVTSTNTSGGTFIGKEKIFNKSDNNIDQATLSEYGLVPIVQALQIDWNGAVLPNYSPTGLNTTGEILSVLDTAYKKANSAITSINVENHYKGSLGAKSSGLYKLTIDKAGHITGATDVAKSDITALGIPGTDTNTDTKVTSVDNHYKGSLGAKTSGLYKVAFDAAGHITSATLVTQNDIVTLIGDYFDSRYQKNKDVQISIPQSITRTKNTNSVSSISQKNGSFKPTEIKVGETSTITKPESITVTYALNNTTATVTISGADSVNQTPIVTSSDPNVIGVNGTTLTAKAEGKSTITVVCNGVTKEQNIEVKNNSNTETKTSGWEYLASNTCVTINGTQITGNSAGTPTIYVTYGGQRVSLGTLTVKSAVNYYWYLGTEKLTTDAQIESKGTPISKSSDITNPFTLPSDEFVYFYYPKAFGKATLTSSGLPAAGKDVIELTGVSLTNYYGWRFPKGALGSIVDIKF